MRVTPLWVRAYRHLLALLVVAAVATQYRFSRSTMGVDPVNFFSFFTIQSNLLLVPIWLLRGGDHLRAATCRPCGTEADSARALQSGIPPARARDGRCTAPPPRLGRDAAGLDRPGGSAVPTARRSSR